MEKGVPENEIAFIHDANTELRKAELFGKVRSGQVRFCLVPRRKWEPEPTCRTDSSHYIIWMYRGVLLI